MTAGSLARGTMWACVHAAGTCVSFAPIAAPLSTCVESPKPIRSFPSIPGYPYTLACVLISGAQLTLRAEFAPRLEVGVQVFRGCQFGIRGATGDMRQNEMKLSDAFG